MNLKLKALTAGVLFFTGQALFAQEVKKDSTQVEKEKEIETLVLLGYTKKKQGESVGNVVSLSSSDINTPSAISVDQALQGKSPGVVVNASSGTPGSVQTVLIRGIGSMSSSNQPLYVIDGVPVIQENVGGALSSSSSSLATSSLSAVASLNNEDIESVTILKDASATALYGARGSNGVIVITTKAGKRGKTKFTLNTSMGFQNDAYMKRNFLSGDQRLALLKQAIVNTYSGKTIGAKTYPVFTADEAINFGKQQGLRLGNAENWNGVSTNWTDIIRNENAPTYSADLSASGGNDKGSFYASLGYNRTESTVKTRAPFERLSGLLKVNRNLTNKIKLETSVNGSWIVQSSISEGGSYFTNPYLAKALVSPWANAYNPDGSYNINTFNDYTGLYNVAYLRENDLARNTVIRALTYAKVDYDITKDLTYTAKVNLDYISSDYKLYYNRYHGEKRNAKGSASRAMTDNYTWVFQNSLNYKFRVAEQHRFNMMAMYEYQKNQRSFLYGYGENFPADGLTNLASVTANRQTESTYYDWKNASYLGMLNYNYANRLILDASIRREGSSKFAPGKRFGTFWSIGGAYNLHKDILSSVFNELRLKASYGLTGNSGIDVNQYQSLLGYDTDYAGNGAVYPSNLPNPNLTWEKNKTFDVGTTFSLLDRRLSGSFSYYNKQTYDLLLSVPISRTNGFSSITKNAGAMENTGIEASLSYDIIKNDNFGWTVSANIATVKNKVKDLAVDGEGKYINPIANSYKSAEVGMPYGYWYMPTWAGVDPQTGQPLWYVNGHSGNTTSVYSQAARVYQGVALPKYSGGFSTNLRFKDLFLNATFYFAGGHKVYEQYAQFYMRTNPFTLVNYNGAEELITAWQKPGDVTNVPQLTYTGDNKFYDTSSRHLYDGTFIRLKDITLGYNIAPRMLKDLGIDGMTITVRGTNLWTWVKDKGLKLDPETGNSGNTMGFTTLTTPPVKSVIVGFNFKF